jgi:hypothetical protein
VLRTHPAEDGRRLGDGAEWRGVSRQIRSGHRVSGARHPDRHSQRGDGCRVIARDHLDGNALLSVVRDDPGRVRAEALAEHDQRNRFHHQHGFLGLGQ